MSKQDNYPYGICKKNVITKAIECCMCKKWVHNKCSLLSKKELKHITVNTVWHCKNCNQLLPFQSLEDTEFCSLNDTALENSPSQYLFMSDKITKPHFVDNIVSCSTLLDKFNCDCN